MKPILVHCHIFYPHLWPELKKCILNISSYPIDLYVTMVEKHPEIDEDIRATFPKAHIEQVANLGYDIGPFMHILNQVDLDDYSYIVKLHTKRDLSKYDTGFRRMHSDIWRNNLLLPYQSKDVFGQYIKNFEAKPQIGMQGYYRLFVKFSKLQDKCFDGYTYKAFVTFLKKNKLKQIPFVYLAGSMFMARAQLFKYIQNLHFKFDDFSVTNRQEKGDLAHVLERFFGYAIYTQGYILQDATAKPGQVERFLKKENLIMLCLQIIRFFFQKKLTKSGTCLIKICKIPVYRRKV